jgi:uncharacterized protein YecE (DUF72 family)
VIHLGCCGFPASRAKYFQSFRLVEVQQTFYQPPRLATAERWRQEAPEGFEFTLKAWQLITHEPSSPTYRRLKTRIEPDRADRYGAFRATDEVFADWRETLRIAQALQARVVVFQCPASFEPTAENKRNLMGFFAALPPSPLTYVWEPRGTWSEEEIRGLCEELGLVHGVDPFRSQAVAGRIRYYRLHGRTGYAYRYTSDDLRALALGIDTAKESYVLFNNVSSLEDAQAYRNLDPRAQ